MPDHTQEMLEEYWAEPSDGGFFDYQDDIFDDFASTRQGESDDEVLCHHRCRNANKEW